MSTPQHIGIIIDGNRRWAAANGRTKLEGHRAGVDALKKLVPVLITRGVPVVSIFTFSTENWQRAREEVSLLMGLIADTFKNYFDWLRDEGVCVRISGRSEDFSPKIQEIFRNAVENTRSNAKLIANFCLSYGGREEIARAARGAARASINNPDAIDEDAMERHLYTAGLPDVDLIVRTGGEKRLSGFLPWQSTYAELYFTDTLWPDFGEAELDSALADFASRKRNFGK